MERKDRVIERSERPKRKSEKRASVVDLPLL